MGEAMSTDPTDFLARRYAAIQAEREHHAQLEAEMELEDELEFLRSEIEFRMERERAQRQKYWEAMVQKRASGGQRP
jgi:hypothetical protein